MQTIKAIDLKTGMLIYAPDEKWHLQRIRIIQPVYILDETYWSIRAGDAEPSLVHKELGLRIGFQNNNHVWKVLSYDDSFDVVDSKLDIMV
jgi:hypothetical protein